jgi:hypothetical protein
MADQKPAEQKNAEQKPQPKKAPLGSAAESSDPAVQQLLAERAIAVSNDDKDAIKAADGHLADLGVSVGE